MASVTAATQRKSSSGIRSASPDLHVTPKLLLLQRPPWPWPGILLWTMAAPPFRDTGWRKGNAVQCTGVASTDLQSQNQQWRVCSTPCSSSSKELSTSSGLQPATRQESARPARPPSAALLWIHAVSVNLLPTSSWFSCLVLSRFELSWWKLISLKSLCLTLWISKNKIQLTVKHVTTHLQLYGLYQVKFIPEFKKKVCQCA